MAKFNQVIGVAHITTKSGNPMTVLHTVKDHPQSDTFKGREVETVFVSSYAELVGNPTVGSYVDVRYNRSGYVDSVTVIQSTGKES